MTSWWYQWGAIIQSSPIILYTLMEIRSHDSRPPLTTVKNFISIPLNCKIPKTEGALSFLLVIWIAIKYVLSKLLNCLSPDAWANYVETKSFFFVYLSFTMCKSSWIIADYEIEGEKKFLPSHIFILMYLWKKIKKSWHHMTFLQW